MDKQNLHQGAPVAQAEPAHTPTPWAKGQYPTELVRDGQLVAMALKGSGTYSQAEVNADFILRAVNCHDNLVAVLKGVFEDLRFAEWASPEHAEDLFRSLINTHHPKLMAALAKAEGRA